MRVTLKCVVFLQYVGKACQKDFSHQVHILNLQIGFLCIWLLYLHWMLCAYHRPSLCLNLPPSNKSSSPCGSRFGSSVSSYQSLFIVLLEQVYTYIIYIARLYRYKDIEIIVRCIGIIVSCSIFSFYFRFRRKLTYARENIGTRFGVKVRKLGNNYKKFF